MRAGRKAGNMFHVKQWGKFHTKFGKETVYSERNVCYTNKVIKKEGCGVQERLLWLATMLGTVACGISGAMTAVDRGMDLVGVLTLGAVTAVGGGIIRDIILNRIPQAFVESEFFLAALGVSLLVFLLALRWYTGIQHRRRLIDNIINVFDAVGLGAYAMVGARATIAMGYGDNELLVLVLGLITAVGGGVLRDLLCVRVPFVLYKRVYLVAALVGTVVYVCVCPYNELVAMAAGIGTIAVVRVLASVFRWDMPRVRPFEE